MTSNQIENYTCSQEIKSIFLLEVVLISKIYTLEINIARKK